MALITRNLGGQLVQEEESLMDKVNNAGVQSPVTPYGAQTMGANLDQAKMAGTPAHKDKVLRDAVSKESTLAYRQQIKAPQPVQQTEQQKQQIAKQQQIAGLGSLGQRVQQQVQSMFNQAAQQTIQPEQMINEQSIATVLGIAPDVAAAKQPEIAAATTAIQDYMKAPSEAKLANIVNNLGMKKSQVYELTGLLEDGQSATGQAVAQAMGDEVSIQDLDVTQLGFNNINELNELLGADVSSMTVPELEAEVKRVQQESASQAANLQARIASLPQGSMERKALEQELAALGDVGLRVSEQEVQEAINAIETADEITIGEETFTVGELLSDEGISDLVRAYLDADQKTKDQILPSEQYGDFRQWIDNNALALSESKAAAEATQKSFEKTQKEVDNYEAETGINAQVLKKLGLDPNKAYTPEELKSVKENIAQTSYGKIANSKLPEGQKAQIIQTLNEREDWAEQLNNWTSEQIAASYAGAQDAYDPTLQSLLGFNTDNPFLNTDQLAKLDQAKNIAALPNASELVKNPGFSQWAMTAEAQPWLAQDTEALADPDIFELARSGAITADELPEDWRRKLSNYDSFETKKEDIEEIPEGDIDSLLDTLFTNTSINDVQKWINQAQADGDQEKVKEYSKLLDENYLRSKYGSGVSLKDALLGADIPKAYDPTMYAAYSPISQAYSDGVIGTNDYDLAAKSGQTLLNNALKSGLNIELSNDEIGRNWVNDQLTSKAFEDLANIPVSETEPLNAEQEKTYLEKLNNLETEASKMPEGPLRDIVEAAWKDLQEEVQGKLELNKELRDERDRQAALDKAWQAEQEKINFYKKQLFEGLE